jgi:2-desacetyl-2-hydroxyethyl bacteriochlorophyllide A dehydrogenase
VRAAFYEGAGRIRVGERPRPSPGPAEALLRMRRVGICGTDLHIFQGHLDHRVPRGGILGHETLGEVVEPPPGSAFRPGDRVVVEPLVTCGRCRACQMGASYLCYELKVLGVDLPGGLQEYWAVPVDRLLRVPAALTEDQGALIEPLAVAVHTVSRAGVRAGDRVMVFGGGPIGGLVALVARHRGAAVVVTEINPYRRDLLASLGLELLDPRADPAEFARDWTGGAGVDVAFEVTGNPVAARAVTGVVRVWGTVSVVAIHAEPVPVDLYRVFARELAVQGSRLYTRADWEEALRLAEAGAVPLAPLVSERVPLEEVADGMRRALGGGRVMKVLVAL